jgi:polysaccharide chain length determinant protein (PEP-CTERM system associated)
VIPGKKYKPEDFLEIAWRRRWYIVVPFVAIAIGTFAVVQLLPYRWQSSALLAVVPQRVPENIVRSTVSSRLDERLAQYAQVILSRTNLERIIQEFDLYPDDRRRLLMEDIVETMRTRDIRFNPGRARNSDSASFSVSFEYTDPRTAMLVAERVASLFIRESVQDRSVLADQTDQFLQSQLEEARRQLKEHENRLQAFRQANPGQMPAQYDANQQALQNAHMQLQALQESINRDRDQLQMIQRQIEDINVAASMPVPASLEPADRSAPMTAARALENAKNNLRLLEQQKKPDHPDVKAVKRLITELEAKAAEEALSQPVSRPVAATPAEQARAARLSELQTVQESLNRRINEKQNEEKRLFGAIATFRQRLEVAPAVESKLVELTRDYTTLQTTYQSLLMKSQEARVAANLERGQIGEQFKIIDNARLPQRPVSPNRARLNFLGALAGIAFGLGLAAVLEYRDRSLRTDDDVVLALSLPVLALVPTMLTRQDKDRTKRRKLLFAASGAAVVLVAGALIAWKFQDVTSWLR